MPPELKPNILLAKSRAKPWRGAYTLVGHTAAVVDAVTTLVDTLGDRLVFQFGLNCTFAKLRATVYLAAYLHDWGKANNQFQMMVRHLSDCLEQPQAIRHEVISILLAWEFREWLQQGEGDFMTAIAAAGGHHLKLGGKAGRCTDELGEIRPSGDAEIYLYTTHANFKALLKYGVRKLGLARTLHLSQRPSSYWTILDIKHRREIILDKFGDWQIDPVFTAVVKSLLVAGDAIGSALPPQGIDVTSWIQKEVTRTLNESDLQNVVDTRLKGNALRQFQVDLGETIARVTLARAGWVVLQKRKKMIG